MGRPVRSLRIGLYSPFFGTTVGGGEKYLGVTAETLRDAFPQHRVEIVSPVPVDVERYEQMLRLDLSGIGFRSDRLQGARLGRRIRRLPIIRRYADLYLSYRSVAWTRDYDLLFSMVYVIPAVSRARRGIILCQFPYQIGSEWPDRLRVPALLYRAYTAPYHLLKRRILGSEEHSFQQVICQSEYVRSWVRRYWQRDSLVVNPPVDVPAEEPDWGAKAPIIVSVGRFFASGHSKRHDQMVQAFRELCDAGLLGWELHLVGSLHRDSVPDVRYFEKVEKLARGYPVHIHTDAALDFVQNLYRKAAIYWHAAGYGVNAEQRPIDLEHFGMTTAEAMGYGAVPVVIARGGQPEVVSEGKCGFLWLDPEGLKAQTLRLIGDAQLRLRMGQAARKASFRFSRPEFKRRMAEAVRPLVHELEAELSGSSRAMSA